MDKANKLIKQLVIPKQCRTEVLNAHHDQNGHMGIVRLYETLRQKVYWYGMYADVCQYTASCITCQQIKRSIHPAKAPLHPLPIETIFGRWHCDALGPLPKSKEGYKYASKA